MNNPPNVSIPKLNGVTSNNRTSLISPPSTPACTAAPNATASSGLMDLSPSFPVISFTNLVFKQRFIKFGFLIVTPQI